MLEKKITTSASDYESLRYRGESLYACALLLNNALNDIQSAPNFSASGRLTLAAPNQRPKGLIDWYWRPSAEAVPPDKLWQQYQVLFSAITKQIAHDPTRDDYAALLLALNATDVSSLHAGPAGPVVAPWGMRDVSGKLQHGDLRYDDKRAPPPQPPAPPPAPAAAPAGESQPIRPATPQPQPKSTPIVTHAVPKRPLGPWQEWVLLLLALAALFCFLYFLPRLAKWFAALNLSCRMPHINWPLWVLLLLGFILLGLAIFWPLKKYLTTQAALRRARAHGTTGGLLQVILTWNDQNDLDLHVICPDGGRIYYGAPLHQDGARLEHDANAANGTITNCPAESVVWHNTAQPGLYGIMVDPHTMRTGKSSAFRITVLYKGRVIKCASGRAYANQEYGPEFQFVI